MSWEVCAPCKCLAYNGHGIARHQENALGIRLNILNWDNGLWLPDKSLLGKVLVAFFADESVLPGLGIVDFHGG